MLDKTQHNLVTATDEQLIEHIGGGNKLALSELYNRYFSKLCWYAQGFLKEAAAAEDVVQEVFIKIIKSPQDFNDTYKFSTWIYTITANKCKNILRDEQNRQRIIDQAGERETSNINNLANLNNKLIKAKLDKWVSTLSDKEQEIYKLRFEQDLSIKEVAEIMQIPEGSVKSGGFYLLKKISEPLKKLMYEE